MPIEGPLRELGIHDVFQLLDLSRKTGMLRVASELRDDEGVVYFNSGRVVHASIRSRVTSIEDVLVQAGRISEEDLARARELGGQAENGASVIDVLIQAGAIAPKELDRLLRQQLEGVVFELMSWREGFFSFEERAVTDVPRDGRISVATESLLMESARRIDEWSRIADKVPNLTVIPSLAPVSLEHETQLDLLPHEWEVLTMIDGERDLRAISTSLRRDEFEVAKIAYGLVSIGVIEIRRAKRVSAPNAGAEPVQPEVQMHLERGFAAVRAGDLNGARTNLEHFLKLAPDAKAAPRARVALDAVTKLLGAMEASGNG